MRSMARLLKVTRFWLASQNGCRSAARPALPHAEFEDRKVGGAQQSTRHQHDVGRGDIAALLERQDLRPLLDLRGVAPAQSRHQGLEGLARNRLRAPCGER